ncbi:hypothetical protein [Bacillus seohaeanensis]|uniref:Uncharacterized protein n=1 Tax=Bacillus seohaeanensis TaxID=284580 RepID=A0ABW5RVK2_9BACI
MKVSFYILFIVLAAVISFSWSWKRLLDFNSYKKPFAEGTVVNFLVLFIASVWWIGTEDKMSGIMGAFYYLLAFLLIMIMEGFTLAYLFSKNKKRGEA